MAPGPATARHRGCPGAGDVQALGAEFGVTWRARDYDPTEWDDSELPDRCPSSATACLYGVSEAAVLAAGYAPAVGFIHTGMPLSVVHEVADVYKFETVVPVAFQVAAEKPVNPERDAPTLP
ncbi:MAG: hypothetical protein Kow0073_14260 [Immundisolibacter sp.]